jgi:hypothetical protein
MLYPRGQNLTESIGIVKGVLAYLDLPGKGSRKRKAVANEILPNRVSCKRIVESIATVFDREITPSISQGKVRAAEGRGDESFTKLAVQNFEATEGAAEKVLILQQLVGGSINLADATHACIIRLISEMSGVTKISISALEFILGEMFVNLTNKYSEIFKQKGIDFKVQVGKCLGRDFDWSKSVETHDKSVVYIVDLRSGERRGFLFSTSSNLASGIASQSADDGFVVEDMILCREFEAFVKRMEPQTLSHSLQEISASALAMYSEELSLSQIVAPRRCINSFD